MTIRINLNTILAVLGILATMGPDLTGASAWFAKYHVAWMTHVAHGLGSAALLCSGLALIMPQLRSTLARFKLATAAGKVVSGSKTETKEDTQ